MRKFSFIRFVILLITLSSLSFDCGFCGKRPTARDAKEKIGYLKKGVRPKKAELLKSKIIKKSDTEIQTRLNELINKKTLTSIEKVEVGLLRQSLKNRGIEGTEEKTVVEEEEKTPFWKFWARKKPAKKNDVEKKKETEIEKMPAKETLEEREARERSELGDLPVRTLFGEKSEEPGKREPPEITGEMKERPKEPKTEERKKEEAAKFEEDPEKRKEGRMREMMESLSAYKFKGTFGDVGVEKRFDTPEKAFQRALEEQQEKLEIEQNEEEKENIRKRIKTLEDELEFLRKSPEERLKSEKMFKEIEERFKAVDKEIGDSIKSEETASAGMTKMSLELERELTSKMKEIEDLEKEIYESKYEKREEVRDSNELKKSVISKSVSDEKFNDDLNNWTKGLSLKGAIRELNKVDEFDESKRETIRELLKVKIREKMEEEKEKEKEMAKKKKEANSLTAKFLSEMDSKYEELRKAHEESNEALKALLKDENKKAGEMEFDEISKRWAEGLTLKEAEGELEKIGEFDESKREAIRELLNKEIEKKNKRAKEIENLKLGPEGKESFKGIGEEPTGKIKTIVSELEELGRKPLKTFNDREEIRRLKENAKEEIEKMDENATKEAEKRAKERMAVIEQGRKERRDKLIAEFKKNKVPKKEIRVFVKAGQELQKQNRKLDTARGKVSTLTGKIDELKRSVERLKDELSEAKKIENNDENIKKNQMQTLLINADLYKKERELGNAKAELKPIVKTHGEAKEEYEKLEKELNEKLSEGTDVKSVVPVKKEAQERQKELFFKKYKRVVLAGLGLQALQLGLGAGVLGGAGIGIGFAVSGEGEAAGTGGEADFGVPEIEPYNFADYDFEAFYESFTG